MKNINSDNLRSTLEYNNNAYSKSLLSDNYVFFFNFLLHYMHIVKIDLKILVAKKCHITIKIRPYVPNGWIDK